MWNCFRKQFLKQKSKKESNGPMNFSVLIEFFCFCFNTIIRKNLKTIYKLPVSGGNLEMFALQGVIISIHKTVSIFLQAIFRGAMKGKLIVNCPLPPESIPKFQILYKDVWKLNSTLYCFFFFFFIGIVCKYTNGHCSVFLSFSFLLSMHWPVSLCLLNFFSLLIHEIKVGWFSTCNCSIIVPGSVCCECSIYLSDLDHLMLLTWNWWKVQPCGINIL